MKVEFFCSLKEINEQLKYWLQEVSHRIHGTVRKKPIDRLTRETLIKIDGKTLYDLTKIYWRKVTRDSFFSYKGNFYSVPFQYACKEVVIKEIDNKHIEITYRQKIIASHAQSNGTGNFIRKAEHFKGLLELRCKHRLNRPKKQKKPTEIKLIKPIAYTNTTIVSRELSFYE